ncbi:MAG: protein phosphatase 2C domain-containing protein [Desulfobacteraceae bacterium]|nr:MAG: protein phosphatase 2C domain-containing protein [Desulfobacteraceae bacterium]
MDFQNELPIYEASLGHAFGCSVKGSSHELNQLPCQDAYSIWTGASSGNPYIILAVADGHGDKKHDLSQYGSFLAVKAAIDEMLSFCATFGLDDPAVFKKAFKSDFPRRLCRKWRGLVKEDAAERLKEEMDSDEQKIVSRYGTTLLVAFIMADSILMAQIGDGDILFVRNDSWIESIFDEDSGLIGSETYSLSSPDAHKLLQTAIIDRGDGGLLILATDGLSNAFADQNQFHVFSHSLLDRIKEYGMQAVSSSVPAWLNKYSHEGSGDDITLALNYIKQP